MHTTFKSAKQTIANYSVYSAMENTGAVGWSDDTNWFLIPKLVEIVGTNWFKP